MSTTALTSIAPPPPQVSADTLATSGPPAIEPRVLLRRLAVAGVVVVGCWLLVMVAWAVFAPISGSVIGNGLVKVEANRLTVTHRDGGVVAQVLVKEGDVVKRGQTLILLEDARVDSSVDLLITQLATEQIRKSRLEAEAAQAPRWAYSVAADATPRVHEALQREQSSFNARQQSLTGQISSLQSQLRDTETELQARARDSAASNEALKLQREELVSNETLLAQEFVNRTRVLGLRRNVSEYESRIQANEAEIAKARARRSELQGQLARLRDAYVQTATEGLAESTARIVDYEERLRSGRDTAGRQAITAPADGRLVSLRVNTVGSALGPRDPVVDIVPSDAPLVVEIHVPAQSIGEVKPGQVAEVKFSAFSQRSTALLAGTVLGLSADALPDNKSGVPFFSVQVAVPAAQLEAAGLPPLAAGMAAEVFIKTTERTPMQWLMEPLVGSIRHAFRVH